MDFPRRNTVSGSSSSASYPAPYPQSQQFSPGELAQMMHAAAGSEADTGSAGAARSIPPPPSQYPQQQQQSKKMRKSSSSTVESGWEESEPAREHNESKLGWSKFTRNLFEMASSPDNGAAIGFNADGDCLEIRNPRLLGSDILPKYYKHKNVSSFVRQLNNYGFKTTPSAAGSSDTMQSFYHENFRRGRLDLLGMVSRRGASKGEKDAKTMQVEITSLKRRESEQKSKARELEEQNRHLIMENNALIEENKRLKANWNVIRDSMGRQKPPPPMHHQQQSQPPPPHGYHDGSAGNGVPNMYASYPDPHHQAAMYRPVQLPLFTPVTQSHPGVMDPSNPSSMMQHVMMDDDFHRGGGPFGNLDS
jgi:hypothetical protein